MWQDLLCMARVTSRCMLCYGTRSHYQRQGPETLYLLLSSYPTHTCILDSLSQELKIILQMVCACMCICVHICVCLCVPTNPQALAHFLHSPSRITFLLQHRELCSMLSGSLDGRGVWGRMDTWILIVESLCRPPETITALLISHTPVQNKQFERNLLLGLTVMNRFGWTCFPYS